MLVRFVFLGALCVAVVLVVAPARAADPPPHLAIRLAYDHGPGVEGCPDESGFRYALMAQFGYDPTEPPLIADFAPPLMLRVIFSRQGAQNRADATLRPAPCSGEASTRTGSLARPWSGTSCS